MIQSKLIERKAFDNGSYVELESETDNGNTLYVICTYSEKSKKMDIAKLHELPKAKAFFYKMVKFLELYD